VAASGPPGSGETLDAISGHFRLFQLEEGHRFSTDDVLVAWYGSSNCPRASRVLELGSGIGSVGIIAAWRLPGAAFVTVEAQEESVRLARRSLSYNGLESRFETRHGDFREPALIASDEKFDLVLGSPPYFPEGTGPLAPHPQKQACRFEMRGSVVDYCQVAARHLAPGGVFAFVFPLQPGHQEARVREAAVLAGLSIVRYRPVALKQDEAPLLGLFLMARAADLPPALRERPYREPVLTIRDGNGQTDAEYSVIKMSFGFPP
jgi:tRNA1(Val) A37 N6-methylase TrmN6